jgi:hypothetical protein
MSEHASARGSTCRHFDPFSKGVMARTWQRYVNAEANTPLPECLHAATRAPSELYDDHQPFEDSSYLAI